MTLFLTRLNLTGPRARFIGYVMITGNNIKIVETQTMEDIKHFIKREGFSRFQWQTPEPDNLYKMQKVNKW